MEAERLAAMTSLEIKLSVVPGRNFWGQIIADSIGLVMASPFFFFFFFFFEDRRFTSCCYRECYWSRVIWWKRVEHVMVEPFIYGSAPACTYLVNISSTALRLTL